MLSHNSASAASSAFIFIFSIQLSPCCHFFGAGAVWQVCHLAAVLAAMFLAQVCP
jgi:hypothetical protein